MILHTNQYIRTIMKRNLLSLGGSAFAAFLFIFSFSSCHDEEVENVSELAYRHAYEDNFVKQYGEISPNQTWDFSSYAKRYKLNGALTRATMDDEYKSIGSRDPEGYYYVSDDITSYAKTFGEREDHKDIVHNFVLSADKACTFEVAYAYQGRSEPDFDLYYVIYQIDTGVSTRYPLFSKGEVYVNDDASYDENSVWNKLGTSWVNNDAPSTADHINVRSMPIKISVPEHSFVYFLIKITDTSTRSSGIQDDSRFGWVGDELSSIDDPYYSVGLVDIDTPANIKAIDPSYEAYLLAIDDYCMSCYHSGAIHDNMGVQDFNDVMFLIAGNVPTPGDPDNKVLKTTIAKRYMIEDLYGYDYDFNDIVVDASQTTSVPYTYVHPDSDEGSSAEGEFVVDYNNVTYSQSVTFKWQCGTLPYQIKVGNKTFGQVTDPTEVSGTSSEDQLARPATDLGGTTTPSGTTVSGLDPQYNFSANDKTTIGWDPNENNITAFIWTRGTATTASYSYNNDGIWDNGWTGVWTSEFPEKGGVPYIIAVDPNVDWMGEEESIFKAHPDWTGGDMTTGN